MLGDPSIRAVNYLDAKQFQAEVLAYNRDPSKAAGDALAKSLYLIAQNLAKKFYKYDNDDAIQIAVLQCLTKAHRFKKSKGTAFNFFTTVVITSFRNTYGIIATKKRLDRQYKDHCRESKTVLSGRHFEPDNRSQWLETEFGVKTRKKNKSRKSV